MTLKENVRIYGSLRAKIYQIKIPIENEYKQAPTYIKIHTRNILSLIKYYLLMNATDTLTTAMEL